MHPEGLHDRLVLENLVVVVMCFACVAAPTAHTIFMYINKKQPALFLWDRL
jgi:hypothetical protein